MRKAGKIAAVLALAAAVLAGCSTDADVAGSNIAKEAEQFQILRRVVFINGITDQYVLEVTGYCNIEDQDTQVEVLCRAAGGEYKKHLLGLSDNMTYFVEQLESVNVSADHYEVIFKPSVIIPDVDVA